MTTTQTPPLAVNEKEAAKLLGVCQKTVFNMRQAGRIRAVRLGDANGSRPRVIYPLSELHRVLAGASA